MNLNKQNLFAETIKLVQESELPVAEICEGADVNYRWYYNLLNGEYTDPGVNKIQRVYNYLKKH